MEFLTKIILESWNILQDSALFMLFGFFVAGLLKAFLPDNLVARHLGKGKMSSVLKAALLGVPIPLCSCGVLPAAAGLREQKASKGATASFLISTPETGVDSIAVTYALLDPLMTVIRPLAAFFTATVTGLFVNTLDKEDTPAKGQEGVPGAEDAVSAFPDTGCSGDGCGCTPAKPLKASVWTRLQYGMTYAFGELLADIGKWFILGILIAGTISAFVSPELIAAHFSQGILPILVMLVVAVPLYVCATASTPIAAALVFKGLSPGAALVFLLAGPATNAASLTVVTKILGKKATVIYLFSIIICSLALGIAVNYLYAMLGLSAADWIQGHHEEGGGLVSLTASIVLMALILKNILPAYFHRKPAGT